LDLDKYHLFVDIDTDSNWLFKTNPLWDDLIDLVRMEALRLGSMYNLGDIAVIMRSDDGWYVLFTRAELTKEEEEAIMISSLGHRGHIYFSYLIHDTTIRASPKSRRLHKNSHEPYLVEILKVR